MGPPFSLLNQRIQSLRIVPIKAAGNTLNFLVFSVHSKNGMTINFSHLSRTISCVPLGLIKFLIFKALRPAIVFGKEN